MPKNIINTGANIDERSEAAKSRDFRHEEIAMAAPVVWKEKSYEELRKFPERFQITSLSCMAQSGTKNLGIANFTLTGEFPVLSAGPVYRNRFNYPNGGMSLPDLLALLCKPKACLESEFSSQNMDENAMNAAPLQLTPAQAASAKKYAADKYVFLKTPLDIDEVAAILAAGKSVQLIMYFDGAIGPDGKAEYWTPKPVILYPKLDLYGAATSRHGIAGVDFLTIDGVKHLYIEDSAGNWTGINGEGRRYVSEAFLRARCYGAGYIVKMAFTDTQKPVYSFTKPLVYDMRDNKDVAALQAILQYEKFMPTEIDGKPLKPTGNFLGLTAQGLKDWQVAHGILDFKDEMDMRKIRFGAKSMKLANTLYA